MILMGIAELAQANEVQRQSYPAFENFSKRGTEVTPSDPLFPPTMAVNINKVGSDCALSNSLPAQGAERAATFRNKFVAAGDAFTYCELHLKINFVGILSLFVMVLGK